MSVGPRPSTRPISGRPANTSITAPGARVATTISMSAIVSRIRRRLPATPAASTPLTRPSASTTACACGSTTPIG